MIIDIMNGSVILEVKLLMEKKQDVIMVKNILQKDGLHILFIVLFVLVRALKQIAIQMLIELLA